MTALLGILFVFVDPIGNGADGFHIRRRDGIEALRHWRGSTEIPRNGEIYRHFQPG